MEVKSREINDGNLLVIGYGNELRSDDGVGPRVAETVAKWKLPRVRVIVCHQLTPELAVRIACAGRVVFIDAAKQLGAVEARELKAEDRAHGMTHAANPQTLLQLADSLYGRCPPALWLTIPAEDFRFGRGLSRSSLRGIETALEHIKGLVNGRFLGASRQKKTRLCQDRRSGLRCKKAVFAQEIKTYARSSSRSGNHR